MEHIVCVSCYFRKSKGFKDKTAAEVVRYPEVHMALGTQVERQGLQSELFA